MWQTRKLLNLFAICYLFYVTITNAREIEDKSAEELSDIEELGGLDGIEDHVIHDYVKRMDFVFCAACWSLTDNHHARMLRGVRKWLGRGDHVDYIWELVREKVKERAETGYGGRIKKIPIEAHRVSWWEIMKKR